MLAMAALIAAQNASTTYNQTLAFELLYMSASAFCPESAIEQWNCEPCQLAPALAPGSIVYLSNATTNATGFVGKGASGTVYVSYRGSDNLENWLQDFDFAQLPWPMCAGCMVHEGFYLDYLSTAEGLMAQLDTLQGTAVLATGHSLGAAIAQVAAWEMAAAGFPLAGLIDFGQPRTGNGAYAAGFRSMVVNGGDGSGDKASGPTVNAQALAAGVPVSSLFVRALERALQHASNAGAVEALGGAAGVDRVLGAVWGHARASAAVLPALQAARRSKAAIPALPAPVTPAEARVLAAVRMLPSAAAASGAAFAHRVVHYHDIVPQLPPQSFFGLNFSHAIQEVWYDAEAGLAYRACSTATGEDPTCSDSNIDLSPSDHDVYLDVNLGDFC